MAINICIIFRENQQKIEKNEGIYTWRTGLKGRYPTKYDALFFTKIRILKKFYNIHIQ